MSLRIACDLDGTLADMDAGLLREARRLFGSGVTMPSTELTAFPRLEEGGASTPSAPTTLTVSQMRDLWSHVKGLDGFWTSLEEIEEGAVARLAAIASRHRWEVIFLTQRPNTSGHTAQVQSQRWLKARGFAHPSVYVLTTSRGALAAAFGLDAVIDDNPDNCLDVAVDSNALPFLVWRGAHDNVPVHAPRAGISVGFSVAGILAELERLEPTHRAEHSIDRLKGIVNRGLEHPHDR